MSNRITLESTPISAIVAMSEGNPGAVQALSELMKTDMGFIDLCHLDDAGIYGSDIWVGYKNVCDFDIEKFIGMARGRTLKSAIAATQPLRKDK